MAASSRRRSRNRESSIAGAARAEPGLVFFFFLGGVLFCLFFRIDITLQYTLLLRIFEFFFIGDFFVFFGSFVLLFAVVCFFGCVFSGFFVDLFS